MGIRHKICRPEIIEQLANLHKTRNHLLTSTPFPKIVLNVHSLLRVKIQIPQFRGEIAGSGVF
jgi:hypothetical protein